MEKDWRADEDLLVSPSEDWLVALVGRSNAGQLDDPERDPACLVHREHLRLSPSASVARA
jgi:hypothetical protein